MRHHPFLDFQLTAERAGYPALLIVSLLCLALVVVPVALIALTEALWVLVLAMLSVAGAVAILTAGIAAAFADRGEPDPEPPQAVPARRRIHRSRQSSDASSRPGGRARSRKAATACSMPRAGELVGPFRPFDGFGQVAVLDLWNGCLDLRKEHTLLVANVLLQSLPELTQLVDLRPFVRLELDRSPSEIHVFGQHAYHRRLVDLAVTRIGGQ